MKTIDGSKDFSRLERLAGRLGVNEDAILEIAERLGISPAMRVDRAVFFDRQQADQIATHLQGNRERLHAKVPDTLNRRAGKHTQNEGPR